MARDVVGSYPFLTHRDGTAIVREPIGVCGLITPWNWPLYQITAKVGPALAAGCTVVLKPSELSPLSALLFAEVMHDAGVPAGVFNLVNGEGPEVGAALATHPDVDMISITGSTRAGVLVAQDAAPTVKRVAQELGGKSPNVILPDADFARAVPAGVAAAFRNVGQSCSAPTRMIVPRERLADVERIACEAASALVVGDPRSAQTTHGPVANRAQFNRVQEMIGVGIAEGARLVCGGPGRPQGLERGFYVRPTLFSDVHPQMRIAQEEIFGPVLAIIPYDSVDEAVEIANGTVYGLGAHVQGQDLAPLARLPRASVPGRCTSTTRPGIPMRPSVATSARAMAANTASKASRNIWRPRPSSDSWMARRPCPLTALTQSSQLNGTTTMTVALLLHRADGAPLSTSFRKAAFGTADPFARYREIAWEGPDSMSAGRVNFIGDLDVASFPHTETLVVVDGELSLTARRRSTARDRPRRRRRHRPRHGSAHPGRIADSLFVSCAAAARERTTPASRRYAPTPTSSRPRRHRRDAARPDAAVPQRQRVHRRAGAVSRWHLGLDALPPCRSPASPQRVHAPAGRQCAIRRARWQRAVGRRRRRALRAQGAPIGWESSERVAKFYVVQNVQA